jgi:hypothetical protein
LQPSYSLSLSLSLCGKKYFLFYLFFSPTPPWLLPHLCFPSSSWLQFLSSLYSHMLRNCHFTLRMCSLCCQDRPRGLSSTRFTARWTFCPASWALPRPRTTLWSGKARAFIRTGLGWSSTTRAALNLAVVPFTLWSGIWAYLLAFFCFVGFWSVGYLGIVVGFCWCLELNLDFFFFFFFLGLFCLFCLSLAGFVVIWSIGYLSLAVGPFASTSSIEVTFYGIVLLVFFVFSWILENWVSGYSTWIEMVSGIEHSFMGLFFLFCLSSVGFILIWIIANLGIVVAFIGVYC